MYVVKVDFRTLMALEPETGKKLWSFEHKHGARPAKGIAYWPRKQEQPSDFVFRLPTMDFLMAVNAKTGKPVPGFATEGEPPISARE